MKIIDAHIHFKKSKGFDTLALNAGHENSAGHLEKVFSDMGIAHAVVMGNGTEDSPFPPLMSYCLGLGSEFFNSGSPEALLQKAEEHLRKPQCVGFKLYPGYDRHYITEERYHPFYALASDYKKPVAVHCGATAGHRALLKYCHPLAVDEAAVDFPNTTFVICHYGNPWLNDTAAVLEKDPNVCADLSGLLDGGLFDIGDYLDRNLGYVELLKTWINYPCAYDRIMYGTDWPLVNMAQYADFIARLIPSCHLNEVFFQNAAKIYSLNV